MPTAYTCEHCARRLMPSEVVTCDTCAILSLRDLVGDERYLKIRGRNVEKVLRRDLKALEAVNCRPTSELG